ncbi:Enamine deaminase RidA, house cleaning of reactive enamine intermediates, YjgF/YER057c/UK114 family [Arthrobacter subterraneus]|uniref:Enamine deaminase RidA, house cleaning of reactive enamine intermediates, YjgF/YER057c/UK114 family n=1 Tax=Arthrobacter subterraneus TaxID=335973 RepID=A0A1G8KL75_9MICC|nr:RidA family protein [Arthrobacter subterraneus]SDI44149.1 Enamine deaminase RidA, house cleaning of reactive enamine intermediates, YjgF/YER057c/UK114 family [Arthrobacter subterraneus]
MDIHHDPIRAIELELPSPPVPIANYVPVRQVGNLVFTSGQTPARDGVLTISGKLGSEVSIEEGQQASAAAVLNCLSALRQHLGSLDRIVSVVTLTGYVASAEGFSEQPAVINGASLVLEKAFGERGRHARAAVGVAELPGNAPVEISLVVEV